MASEKDVAEMLETIVAHLDQESHEPDLYLDLEGDNLGREGKLSPLQAYHSATRTIYILYVEHMKGGTFSTSLSNTNPTTLKNVLESEKIVKAFWDCRADSDVLFSNHGIRLSPSASKDLQLLELATIEKARDRNKVRSLDLAVRRRLNLPRSDFDAWVAAKHIGGRIMNEGPAWKEREAEDVRIAELLYQCTTSLDEKEAMNAKTEAEGLLAAQKEIEKVNVWEEFPLRREMVDYADGDVVVLPLLYHHLAGHERLTAQRRHAVAAETRKRIESSQAADAPVNGNQAPEGWSEKNWCKSECE